MAAYGRLFQNQGRDCRRDRNEQLRYSRRAAPAWLNVPQPNPLGKHWVECREHTWRCYCRQGTRKWVWKDDTVRWRWQPVSLAQGVKTSKPGVGAHKLICRQLTVQELSVMIRVGVKPIIFVLNNKGYTIERYLHGEKRKYNDISNWYALLRSSRCLNNPFDAGIGRSFSRPLVGSKARHRNRTPCTRRMSLISSFRTRISLVRRGFNSLKL